MPSLSAYLPALPWIVAPILLLWRGRSGMLLENFPPLAPDESPLISVIVPARNESRNVERCLRSILEARNARIEVILVDDHSTDDTRALAEAIAAEDHRLRVVTAPPLPEGWFGKQWACSTGARAAGGDVLMFTDADTEHAPDLASRATAALLESGADLLSVMGHQVLGSFWELTIQPQAFGLVWARYGGTDAVNRASRASDVIAAGQCLLLTRESYERAGGHEAVRAEAAEDLMLAQTIFRAGGRVRVASGTKLISTRMYSSLAEIVEGWSKNVYAAGRKGFPLGGTGGRLLFPLVLVLTPLVGVVPLAVLLLAIAGIGEANAYWAAAATVTTFFLWALIYVGMEQPPWYALLYPLGAIVFAGICLRATVRGRNVRWKGRAYRAA
jgi:chlorobactene glucosyltransferase